MLSSELQAVGASKCFCSGAVEGRQALVVALVVVLVMLVAGGAGELRKIKFQLIFKTFFTNIFSTCILPLPDLLQVPAAPAELPASQHGIPAKKTGNIL